MLRWTSDSVVFKPANSAGSCCLCVPVERRLHIQQNGFTVCGTARFPVDPLQHRRYCVVDRAVIAVKFTA